MNKLLRIFRYAGFSLIFIALVSIANRLINAVDNYNAGQLSINLTENNVAQQVKTIGAAKFTNSHFGTYTFKPTLKQAIILSDKELDGIGAYAAFYLIIGSVILFIAYTRPKWLEDLTENRLWQLVGTGGILFFALKFLFFFLMKGYVEDLTGKAIYISAYGCRKYQFRCNLDHYHIQYYL
ncbi:hypothetical protein IM793_21345 [Pedobacter sp. MR2016-19]|uniref:hypothetical protein n=1 Tax=Pedobacter sp. MR2016-19 TaxID=2780089 RepID=UPI001874F9A3|nr:hypothetical protein [Pedobacter sp. MR2016-19]MBE5321720.1 hypothetical protein [Pedobacter sp. MR2016-19]